MNVILYARVSTDEQADGSSLEVQAARLKDYCRKRGYTIVGDEQPYNEDYSAKHFDLQRPAMKKIYEYCKKHNGMVNKILFYRWDRYARNVEFAFAYKRKFMDELGVEINAIESPIDFASTEWATMLAIYCGVAHTEDIKISRRTRDGIHGTLLKGRCANKAPRGYKNVRTSKHETHVEIDEPKARLVQRAFKEVAKGIETPCRIRRRLCPMIAESSYFNMLRNVFYIGKIRVPAYHGDPELIIDGLHEPLIDSETFYKVQDILDGKRKRTPKLSKKINPDLYLRKFLVCPICGRALTGSTSSGNGGKYTYYHCNKDGKHIRRRADEVNEGFARYLGCLRPNEAVLRLYCDILKDMQGDGAREVQRAQETLKKEIEKVEELRNNLDDKYCAGSITDDNYNRISKRYELQINELQSKINMLDSNTKGVKKKLDYSMNIINNLTNIMRNDSVEMKIKVLGSMFPEKIEFDGEKYRTNSYNKVLDLIYQNTNELRGGGNKNGEADNNFSNSVPRAGVEPARVAPLVFETSASTDSAIWASMRVQR